MIARELAQAGFSRVSGYGLVGLVESGITAAGSAQTDAYALTRAISNVTSTGTGTGVRLPAGLQAGDSLTVRNGGANALLVYPPTGGVINALSANAGYSVAAGKTATITAFDDGLLFGGAQSA